MKITAALLATAIIAGTGGAAVAHQTNGDGHWPYLTKVTGTARSGFHLTWQNGTETAWPTRSEALTECTEYEKMRERVTCRVTVRQEYSWIGITKRSINHAR